MNEQPRLLTPRLVLRPFALTDAPDVQRLAGAREVASTTLNIAHPYPDGAAEAWISTHASSWASGESITCAVTRRDAAAEHESGALVGAISLSIEAAFDRAEMGYWMGVPYWNQGYCTEAACELLRYAFEVLGLNRVMATHLVRNPASGRVMQKAGMTYEGCLRQHAKKWGQYDDLALYAILREEYEARESK
jgi:RimJ/RimL family protein N-acetyltransferase